MFNILVVEDDKELCRLFCKTLIKSGYNAVKTAEAIQENVKNAVASMLGLTVAKVNVNIVNVEFSQ